MAMGLLYKLHIMVQCVCYVRALDPLVSDLDATIPNDSVTTGWTSLVGVDHSRSDSIMPLMLHTVFCAMAGASALYYRSLGTISFLLKRGNISGRPCMGVMTYKHETFLH
jgi:hypothetical protein